MQYKTIQVKDLLAFVESELYQTAEVLPITKERAISQYYNPNAERDDVALIIALDDTNRIRGFIGILPEKLYIDNTPEKFYWNTCWWVDPDHGRPAAMPLFYMMLKHTNAQLIFFDLTPKTYKIIDTLPYFTTVTKEGVKAFLRFNFSGVLPSKHRVFHFLYGLLKGIDNLLNGLILPYLNSYKTKCIRNVDTKSSIEIDFVSEIDDEATDFIEPLRQNQFIQRGKNEFDWMIKYPWINTTQQAKMESYKYPFSVYAASFNNYFVKIRRNQKIIAFLFLTEREKHFKIPYCFFEKANTQVIGEVIKTLIIEKKGRSVTTWNQHLKTYFSQHRWPFLFTKKIPKYMAFPAKAAYDRLKTGAYQDGDGDEVFT